MHNTKKSLTLGFTIVELLIVIVIIGILATLTGVVYNGIQAKAYDTSVLSDIDTMDSAQTSYGLKNSVAGKEYYSGSGYDADLDFEASEGNVIDVVANGADYCIRGYNPKGVKDSIDNSYSKGSTETACVILSPSASTGSTGASIIGWWRLNGSANDETGGGANGTVNNAVLTSGEDGSAEGAYEFNGDDQFISIPAVHDPAEGAVSFWFRTKTPQPADTAWYIFSHPQSSDNSRIYINTNVDGTLVTARLGNGASIGAATITPNAWHNIIVGWSGAMAGVYVDGAVVAEGISFNGLSSAGATSWFGCLSNSMVQCS
ncbi:MAG TPA: LamG-like jellyroll fold domain-containing protein, partial [Candidatus Saccharimonadales bacterium]|nr:LamG-like jellyroll fold domain-containing protein [Candidatus Saccharimonadales bacterium]